VNKRKDARDKILGAAIYEFSRHGFERAISHIATRAKVNEVTVYRLFRNKSNLQLAALLHAQTANPMVAYMRGVLAEDRVPPPSVVIAALGKIACGEGRDLIAMLYFAGLQNRKILMAWEDSPDRNRLMIPLREYADRLHRQGRLREIDPDVLSRGIIGSMLSLFSRNCVFSKMSVSDPDSAETASLVAILERKNRHSIAP
jgi:AcrR family transcriptional regulator